MLDSVCYCGASASFPHAWDCPRPLFRGSESEVRRWEAARADLRWAAARDARAVEGASFADEREDAGAFYAGRAGDGCGAVNGEG